MKYNAKSEKVFKILQIEGFSRILQFERFHTSYQNDRNPLYLIESDSCELLTCSTLSRVKIEHFTSLVVSDYLFNDKRALPEAL